MWTAVSYCFSIYAPIRYVVYSFPFVATFSLTRLNAMAGIPDEVRLDFLLWGRGGPEDVVTYILLVVGIVMAVLLICSAAALKKLRWRLENE